MGINIAFDGFIYKDGSPTDNVYVRAYYLKVAGSEPSQWNTVQLTADGGYYNFNLGDADFLGQDGSVVVSTQDFVVIAAWFGNASQSSDSITYCSYYTVDLNGSSNYTKDFAIQQLSAAEPVSSQTDFPSTAQRLVDFVFSNTSQMTGTIASPGTANGVAANVQKWAQAHNDRDVVVFSGLRIESTSIDWKYGDVPNELESFTYGVKGDPSYSITRQYSDAAGTARTVRMIATNGIGVADSTPLDLSITILGRIPVGGITPDDSTPQVNQLITWTPSITDLDTVVTSVDYSFDGGSTWPVTGETVSYQPTFTPATSVDFTIVQRIHYDPGNGATYLDYTRATSVYPISDWTVATDALAASAYVWTEAATGTITNYAWTLYDVDGGLVVLSTSSGVGATAFAYNFTAEGNYRLRLVVTDSDGESDTKTADFAVTITALGGAESVFLRPIGKGVLT